MSGENIETITHGLESIALIIRADYDGPGIQFFTPGSFSKREFEFNTRFIELAGESRPPCPITSS